MTTSGAAVSARRSPEMRSPGSVVFLSTSVPVLSSPLAIPHPVRCRVLCSRFLGFGGASEARSEMWRQYNSSLPVVTRHLATVLMLAGLSIGLAAGLSSAEAQTSPPAPEPPHDHVIERTHDAMGTVIVLKAWG